MDGDIGEVMKITIPNHKAISWNKLYSSPHWKVRSKLAKEIHALIWGYCFDGNSRRHKVDKKVDVSITAYYKDKRRHDSDNICAKLYIDGLKELLKDDDTRYVGRVTTEAKIGQKEDKVVICLS